MEYFIMCKTLDMVSILRITDLLKHLIWIDLSIQILLKYKIISAINLLKDAIYIEAFKSDRIFRQLTSSMPIHWKFAHRSFTFVFVSHNLELISQIIWAIDYSFKSLHNNRFQFINFMRRWKLSTNKRANISLTFSLQFSLKWSRN